MIIGCLGDIAFEVSSSVVKTVSNAKWSGSVNYSTHKRHGTNALTEFVSINPDKFTFDMVLSAYLGVNPQESISKIFQYEREGKTLPLVIGDKAYGKYRWTILSHSVKLENYDGSGNVTSATVSMTLQEYLRS